MESGGCRQLHGRHTGPETSSPQPYRDPEDHSRLHRQQKFGKKTDRLNAVALVDCVTGPQSNTSPCFSKGSRHMALKGSKGAAAGLARI